MAYETCEITNRADGRAVGYLDRSSYDSATKLLGKVPLREFVNNKAMLQTARILAIVCPACEAAPGRWCRAKDGRLNYYLHDMRWEFRLPERSSFDVPQLHPEDRDRLTID